ncbi:MAG: energy-coupling factor transporter ATPase [Clostridiales bacterium]|nr:energy-coupling factor transporter ATPase [Clostridiales bacterium]
MAFITAKNLKHRFAKRDEEGQVIGEVTALDGIDLEVQVGQFIAVLGRNGSGKSTFAKHLNVLLTPTEGTLVVDGRNVGDVQETWKIRQSAGMIFQNPDNQIVAGVVEEDVAFGPENLGIPTEEICERVTESLDAVGMSEYRHHSPNKLSGGQKQRVAVASVVAMHPQCIIMDESTAMLDPSGRREVLKTAHRLNREDGVTIILITHYMEEAADADFVFVLERGRVAMQGTPREIFSRVDELKSHGMDVPQMTRLAYELREDGYPLPKGILNRSELADALAECLRRGDVPGRSTGQGDTAQISGAMLAANEQKATEFPEIDERKGFEDKERMFREVPEDESDGLRKIAERQEARKEKLRLEDVSYSYGGSGQKKTPVLKNINLTVYEEDFIGIIGHTGSGKSTMIQLFNGLLKADEGRVYYEGQDIGAPDFSLRALRGKVGLVFQYPEYQLFEETVLKDVAFGPKNQGMSEEEALFAAREALGQVKLPEECWEMSPFELSGGQKRRAAIAGVIAMNPSVLVLDEPTAGLDPGGRDELFGLIRELHENLHITVLLVSHSMEDVAEYVNRIVVMNHGEILMEGQPSEIFTRIPELEKASLAAPQVMYLLTELARRGYSVSSSVTTLEEAKREIERLC